MKLTLVSIVFVLALFTPACKTPNYNKEDSIWDRVGGVFNPWGGEFLDFNLGISKRKQK